MRKMLIILTSTLVTALNISALGQLDYKVLENAKQSSQNKKEIVLTKSIN